MSSGQGSQSTTTDAASDGGSDAAKLELKRRRLLDAGGPVEDDEVARQKMRDAEVYERRGDNTFGDYAGFDPDNVADIKIFYWDGKGYIKPMGYFAQKGDLLMMRWLYVNGADTRDVDLFIYFPMFAAARRGHLDVCKWLFDHGAAKDIKRRTRENPGRRRSPLHATFRRSTQRGLSRWLILNGALCKDDNSGKLDVEIMKLDLGGPWLVEKRKALLEWANDLHRARTSFLLFLSGALSASKLTRKHTYKTSRAVSSSLQLLGAEPGIRELIGDHVGFVRGREARIIRQLTEMLPKLLDSKA